MPNRAPGLRWDGAVDTDGASVARAPRGALSRQAIVDAAIVVADAEGLDAVSIRRVAAEIGVRPMSLYTHIASKDDLLDLMANELVGLMLIDELPTGDWREALSAIARRSHTTFVAHPWVLAAFTRRPKPGPNAALHAKQMALAVSGLGLTGTEMWALLGIVDDYVLGNALRVATTSNARELDASFSVTDRAEVPELTALTDVTLARESPDSFETGLQAVLDGVALRFLTHDRVGAV